MLDELHRPFVAQVVEEATDVGIELSLAKTWAGLKGLEISNIHGQTEPDRIGM